MKLIPSGHREKPFGVRPPGTALGAGLVLCSVIAAPLAWSAESGLPGYSASPLELPPDTRELVLVDADGDGLRDLLAVRDHQLELYFQNDDGGGEPFFDLSQPATLTLPGRATGWDISFDYPAPGAEAASGFSILALQEGNRISAWSLSERRFGDERVVLDGLNGFLGHGFYRLRFSRDINNDGLEDLLIPGAGELGLYIREDSGQYQRPIYVRSDARIRTNLFSESDLERDVGQSVRIPMMELRDVNSDDSPDLISSTEERLDVFLAQPGEEEYFSPVPAYSIDRAAIRQRLGSFDVDQLDLSNLAGVLSLTHEELLQDVNNDGIEDFVLREGGKVSLFLASSEGVDFSSPDQILRSGGNVLTAFLNDENEDGLKDLWLWRVESVSVGDIFLWLALSGSLDIEAFIYPNTGQGFDRRPSRRLTVTLRFPSAIRVMGSVNELRRAARESGGENFIPTAEADLFPAQGGGGASRDLLALIGERLDVFVDAATAEDEDPSRFLGALNYSRNRDNYEIDISRIIEEADVTGGEAMAELGQRAPDYSISLNREQRQGRIVPVSLNDDGRQDLLLLLRRDNDAVYASLLLSE